MKIAAALLALALAACATPPASAPSIHDTSFVDAQGSRTIRLSGLIPAAPAEVYAAVATLDGWKKWAVPVAFGEVKAGGIMETSYNPAAKPGDATNIQQEFLELVPDRRVVFHTVKAPAGFADANLYYKTIVTIDLAPEGAGTRLTFSHAGFGPGAGYDKLHGFFLEGDAQTLEELRKLFSAPR